MSFLAGRLAGKEGAYFFQESKQAVNRLAQKIPTNTNANAKTATEKNSLPSSSNLDSLADVLPEVLRHSLPSNIFGKPLDSSSLSTASKWNLHSDPSRAGSTVFSDALNPLRGYVSLPQVTFGPKRWQLPNQEHAVQASTANDMRKDKYVPLNPEKLKAAAEGLAHVGKAFAVATGIVLGGTTVVFGMAASKLEIRNGDDIRNKGKDLLQPKFDMIKDQFTPLRTWAVDKSKKWHHMKQDEIKEKPIVKELSKLLGAKTSS